MKQPLHIAVVGHTNAGKTSLLRTLTRQVAFGEVSDRPGTTRHAESIELRVDGAAAVGSSPASLLQTFCTRLV